MSTTILVPLAAGFEEIEAVTLIDLLRRAGALVTTASLGDEPVCGSHGITVVADRLLDEVVDQPFSAVVLPGGQPGSDHLAHDARIKRLLQAQVAAGRHVAAICAAPLVLAGAGLLDFKAATGYPGVLGPLNVPGLKLDERRAVVHDGLVITARGPGTAIDFALDLIGILIGAAQREAVESSLKRV
jgi:4-methyl-5(b-hydroxyethyl)-thiazole monophosphate biosynthesis